MGELRQPLVDGEGNPIDTIECDGTTVIHNTGDGVEFNRIVDHQIVEMSRIVRTIDQGSPFLGTRKIKKGGEDAD